MRWDWISLDISAIKTLSTSSFWLFVAILGLFIAYFFYQSYKLLLQARTIEDTPTAKIRSAAQGYVELEGTQQFFQKQPLIAPLSRQPCTWYRFTVEHYQKDRWKLIEQNDSSHLFELDDGTGRCFIDPKGAQITTSLQDRWFGFRRRPQGKPKNLFMRLLGLLGRYRYREWRMEQGMSLYAIGHFQTIYLDSASPNPELFEQKIQQQFGQWTILFQKFLVTANLNNQLPEEQWKKQFAQVHTQINQQLPPNSQQLAINILNKEGLDSRHPFLLSAYQQKKLIRQARLHAFFSFSAYLLLLLIAGWLLIARFS